MINTLPPNISREAIKELAEETIYGVDEGMSDALSVFIKSAAIEKIAKEIKDGVRDEAVKEANLYNPRYDRMEIHGVGFQSRRQIVRLDYSGDEEWLKLERYYQISKHKRKKRQDYLRQQYYEPDLETGEITVNVTLKYVTPATIKVFFKTE